MSVIKERMTAILVLSATTPRAHTTVLVNLDTLEMERSVKKVVHFLVQNF